MAKMVRSGVLVLLAAAWFAGASLSGASAAEEAKRVALIIGNGAYQFAPRLPNPANDARDVAQLLRGLDFEVVEAVDVDRAGFVKALGAFMDKAAKAPAALLYYGGHGVQVGDDNFLLPVDAKLDSLFSLKNEALSLHDVLDDLEAVSKVNLVFLDACRDNPLAEQLSRAIRTRSGASPLGRGLARVAPNSANTFVAFAAAPGAVALDGTGRNSPFAKAFLSNVAVSDDDVMIVFKGIIRDVEKATAGQQRPQMVSGMTVDFHFNGDTSVVINAPAAVSEAQAAYEAAAKIGTPGAYQAVADTYPKTIQAKLALAAIEKLETASAAFKEPAAKAKTKGSEVAALPPPADADGPAKPGEARRIDLAALPDDADPRLRRALGALAPYEVNYGFFNHHLYIAVLTWSGTWKMAEDRAEAAGGHLVTITSKAENDFVYALFKDDERFVALEDSKWLNGPWIGLYQEKGAREPAGGWRWVTGEPLGFNKWQPWGPDNWTGHDTYGRFWGTVTKTAALRVPIWWDDATETDEFRSFVMEVE